MVLVDDDELIRMVWAHAASSAEIQLHVFSEPDPFLAALPGLSRAVPIYIDANLRNGVRGEDVSRCAFELGFNNIFLTSGYPASWFRPMAWVRAVLGKDPPFGATAARESGSTSTEARAS